MSSESGSSDESDHMMIDDEPSVKSTTTTNPKTPPKQPQPQQQESNRAAIRAAQQESLPWVEKYRPKDFSGLIAHQDIISTLERLIDQNRLPHLLLYGPPGTGKTSTILACARRMYGANYHSMVLELNASDDRGIDVVREQIKDFASTRKIFSSGVKLVILDEADNMTTTAQAALRRVIEKFTKNTRFCLICNYISKIIPALQSRCTRFRFGPLPKPALENRVKYVMKEEKVEEKVTADGLKAIIQLGEGDMRKCLNILQSTCMAYEKIDADAVYQCTGNPQPKDIRDIVEWLLNEDFSVAYQNILNLKTNNGLALQDIVREIHLYVVMLEISPKSIMQLLKDLAEVEYRLMSAATEKVQLGCLVGSFQVARNYEERLAADE
eukprot:TRINITY_DN9036_c0_g1_i1.p1 TRINITY_DN9036_c0_g1~~TRINITY_DN9036_c0_g1_i1.p1  ORF type:complete len:382 (-),score=101.21 TRINITY_DN9036_c0_g1_i1:24-1169(-)